jgi:hypothetical protein
VNSLCWNLLGSELRFVGVWCNTNNTFQFLVVLESTTSITRGFGLGRYYHFRPRSNQNAQFHANPPAQQHKMRILLDRLAPMFIESGHQGLASDHTRDYRGRALLKGGKRVPYSKKMHIMNVHLVARTLWASKKEGMSTAHDQIGFLCRCRVSHS